MSFQKLTSVVLKKASTLPEVIVAVNSTLNYLNAHVQNFIGKPQCNQQLLTDLVLRQGTNTITHKLNIPLTGYMVCNQTAEATFYNALATVPNSQPDVYLYLWASAPCTVSLLVF